MPPHPPPRTSPCLFCSFVAASPRLRPSRVVLLSRSQAVHRSTAVYKKSDRVIQAENARRHLKGRTAFDPRREAGQPVVKQTVLNTVDMGLERLRRELAKPAFLETSELTREAFDEQWKRFVPYVRLWAKKEDTEVQHLTDEARMGKREPLHRRLLYWFYAQAFGDRFTEAELQNQKEKADLRYPSEWYPVTRQLCRTVHLHVGPTNSGKTYHALQRLEQAKRGIYLGPLRLLAHEIYTRLNAKGIPCALVTGEETRMPDVEPTMWSCTVEMAPLNMPLDVAVIDEIQMINHAQRGWAWTQSFLGVQAKEVHLCGEARTVPIIKELCALTGDKIQVHEYERLTPLEVAEKPLGSFDKLEKGDCVVVFSVLGIHALRREIERKTGKNCAIVYGSLPPETRAQQARLFNDPDNDYDFLVASDAVGMGLNLAIKRIIFESTVKHDGREMRPLEISDLKQIAGRAGRYKTAYESNQIATAQQSQSANPGDFAVSTQPNSVGIATTLDQIDFKYLKAVMRKEPEVIKSAGLSPPSVLVERFAQYFPPGTPFSYILLRLNEISTLHPRFHLCTLKEQLPIADAIHTIKNLSISDRNTLCAVPTQLRNVTEKAFFLSLVKRIAEGRSINLLDIPELPLECLDEPISGQRKYLARLETLHKCIVTYLWLSYRFANLVGSRKVATYAKEITENVIEKTLMEFTWTRWAKRAKRQRTEALKRLAEEDVDKIEEQQESSRQLVQQLGLPPVVEDVLKDRTSFAESSPRTDDEGELPAEDIEMLSLQSKARAGTEKLLSSTSA